MSRYFIVSVGTSFIAWVQEKYNTVSSKEDHWSRNEKTYKRLISDYVRSVLSSPNDVKKLGAELSSLFTNSQLQPTEDDEVHLVHTQTKTGKACAKAIQKILKDGKKIEKSFLHKVEGLREAKADKFFQKGLPNLIDFLHNKIHEARKAGQEVILVPTGGYKAIIPYFVIAGILYDCPCIYVYEDSDLVVELPALPLHVDLVRWSTLRPLVELFEGRDPKSAEGFIPFDIKRKLLTHLLIESEDSGSKKFRKSALCQALAEKADEDMRRPVLQFRTLHSPLLDFLEAKGSAREAEGSARCRKLFKRLAAIGPHLWKGDRVPEMADHALLHHADLFQIAERFLLPIFQFYQEKKLGSFLQPKELLVLLGALHLHDCGHVIGTVKLKNGAKVTLFPTEIRDHHHVLGYLRLTEPEGYQGEKIVEALKAPDGTAGVQWSDRDINEILRAMAVVGLFHRKAMKFYEGEYKFIEGHEHATIPALKKFLDEKPLSVNGHNLEFERVALLVSLLRIIDCLDEQGARTGGKEAVEFHESVLLTEAQEEEDRAERLRKAIETIRGLNNPDCLFNQLDRKVEALVGWYAQREARDGAQSTEAGIQPNTTPCQPAEQKLTSAEFRKKVESLLDGNKTAYKALIDEYLMSKIRAAFKRLQKEHFSSKLAVREVVIKPEVQSDSSGNHRIHFEIDLLMEKGKSNWQTTREKTLASMKQEYEVTEEADGERKSPVKEFLKEKGIVLEFK